MINVSGNTATVEDTASEVTAFKMSAISKGYYNDKYMKYFAGDILYGSQLPHQNFGTYLRNFVMNYAVKKFYSIYGEKSQVVSLGSGFDTLFWRLRDENVIFSRYVEIDKKDVVTKKRSFIKNEVFQSQENYFLEEIDLNSENSISNIEKLLIPDIPTLFIDEFSLIYLNPEIIERLYRYISKESNIFSYSMTNMNDDFGKLILEGFQDLSVPLNGVNFVSSTDEFVSKMLDIGFPEADAQNAVFVAKNKVPISERQRVSRLEYFDDPREVDFILSHYAFYAAGSKEFIKDLLK